jgi:branched-chain amino acid transport system ATP-binding protein
MASLEIADLSKSFGALSVISNLSMTLASGERHAVIGPNGAGKTTLFNLITGWLASDRGQIRVDGTDIAGLPPQEVTRRGIARSFQRNTLMNGLTVGENLRLAAQAKDASRFALFANRLSFKAVLEHARAAADQMQLSDCFDRAVSELSYGQKRQLEVAMALCCEPRILLLDEPAAGTSPAERAQLVDLINRLPRGVTLILVEHDMDVVFDVCERITVLSYGKVLATGSPEAVRNDPAVRDAYLGKSRA